MTDQEWQEWHEYYMFTASAKRWREIERNFNAFKKFIDAHTCYWTHNDVASIVRNAMFADGEV